MAERKRSRLIEMLLEQKIVTDVQLNRSKAGIYTNCEVYSLVSAGYISDINVVAFITKNARVPFVELESCRINPEVLGLATKEYCSENCCIPISKVKNSLSAAMVDPLDGYVTDELSDMTGLVVRPVLCSLRDFLNVMKTAWIDFGEEGEENAEKDVEADIAGS